MKRLILIAILLFSAVTFSYAQESAAKRAFTAGDYSAAVELYQAAIATAGTNSALSSGLDSAKKCASLKKKADAAYSSGSYKTAQQNYQAILKLNPSDSYVRGMLDKCSAKDKEAKAEERQNLEEVLRIGTTQSMSAFAEKYPKNKKSDLFRKYCSIIGNEDRLLTPEDVSACLKVGKLLNPPACNKALDAAISYGDTEAMYVRAMARRTVSDSVGTTDLSAARMMDLLGMAASAGHEQAQAVYDSYYEEGYRGTLSYPAKRLEEWRRCDRDVSTALDILIGKNVYPLTDSSFLTVRALCCISSETVVLSAKEELRIYDYQLTLDLNDPLREKLLRALGRRGNLNADKWLTELPSCTATEKIVFRHLWFKDCNWGMDKEKDFSKYVKYLKGDIDDNEMASLYWWLGRRIHDMRFVDIDWGVDTPDMLRHEYLLAVVLYFKEYEWDGSYKTIVEFMKENKGKEWDKEIIQRCIDEIPQHSTYFTRQLKSLFGGLVLKTGLYNKQNNILYKYANEGYFDNMHRNSSLRNN